MRFLFRYICDAPRLYHPTRLAIMRSLLPCFLLLWSIPIQAQSVLAHKCSPALQIVGDRLHQTDDRRVDKEQKMLFTLVVAPLAEFRHWARQNGLAEYAAYPPAGVIVLEDQPRHFFTTTLLRTEVIFADLGHPAAREELPVPGHNLFVNHIQWVHTRWPVLDGAGSTISIKEFRFDSADVDFKNRYLPTFRSASLLTTHANIMASLAAGAGTSDPAGRGVARGSRLVSSSFVGLLPDDDADYDAFDISVQNHSYGVDIENYYGAGALAYDESVRQHPNLLHVFSAGNQGAGASASGPYASLPGFANLTGNFKMAKNVLVVGAVDSLARVASFSSRGPAHDGRLKPDLVAFGVDGTSGAAALVSGAAAVVRQAIFESHGYWPGSDVVKAVLIGTADDLGAPGPDFSSGYGNLNLKKAVELVQQQSLTQGIVGGGETQLFSFQLPPNVSRCKITLSWNDVPAQPNAGKALVNDLDLSVQSPDGTGWQPWVCNAYPHPDSLSQPARRGRDSINTLEQVSIGHPASGLYQLRVRGNYASTLTQSFALSFHWDTLAHFEWTCPVRQDPALAGKEAILRWETTMTAAQGELAWKPAGSTGWKIIDPAVVLATGYRRWLVPDTVTAAQVRMRSGGRDFISDTFLIAPALRLRIGFNCADSVMLQWPALAGNLLYRVWGLGDHYLEPLLVTTDTTLVLQKSAFPQRHFAISAMSMDKTAAAPTSGAPNIFTQGAGCYINNLLAFLNADDQVELTLTLGTLYGVDKVIVEKWRQGAWVVLAGTDPAGLKVFFTDLSPQAGTNVYRARVDLTSGGRTSGDPVTVYFAGGEGYLVLPNPVVSSGLLTVLARVIDEVPQFLLYDALGRRVLERSLDDVRVNIQLPALPPGYYAWRVVGDASASLRQGKILVR